MAHRPKPLKKDFGTSRNDQGSYFAALRTWEAEHAGDTSTEVENNDNADENNKWLTDQLKEYNVPVLENQTQVDQFLGGQKVDGFPQFDDSTTESIQKEKFKKDVEAKRLNRLKKYGKRKQGGVLRYPAESITKHADYLQIDIERYAEIGKTSYVSDTGGSSRYVIGNRRQNRAGMTEGVSLTRRPLINDGTILLPIPSNVSDANNVSYGESRLNGLAAAGISAAESMANKGLDSLLGGESFDLKTAVGDAGGTLGKKILNMMGGDGSTAATTAADIITKQLTASAVNIFDANVTANQLLARANGEIINPNLEILFSDVTLRNFAFRYKLTPRNKYEAEQVKLIIRAFKRNMAPQAIGSDGASDFFLRSPNVFKLRYRSGNRDHPFLNKFKQCFLSDMQTRYTGEGTYSTYDDGTPVSIELSLSFKELQPIYDLDYDEFPGTGGVGY